MVIIDRLTGWITLVSIMVTIFTAPALAQPFYDHCRLSRFGCPRSNIVSDSDKLIIHHDQLILAAVQKYQNEKKMIPGGIEPPTSCEDIKGMLDRYGDQLHHVTILLNPVSFV